jgi:hypothetical protein
MTKGISAVEGSARRVDGSEVVVYRALRDILCSSCYATIGEGSLFTRRALAGGGLRIAAQCRECVPFVSRPGGEKGRRSELLESLFSAESEGEPPPRKDAAAEAVLKRLGPALHRRDKKS